MLNDEDDDLFPSLLLYLNSFDGVWMLWTEGLVVRFPPVKLLFKISSFPCGFVLSHVSPLQGESDRVQHFFHAQ